MSPIIAHLSQLADGLMFPSESDFPKEAILTLTFLEVFGGVDE
ncbi:MAG TPA: hypothetical protein DCZ88_10350 [Pseudanabaena sp.]|nr:hypothetical protein [Pseudanabaena sp.]